MRLSTIPFANETQRAGNFGAVSVWENDFLDVDERGAGRVDSRVFETAREKGGVTRLAGNNLTREGALVGKKRADVSNGCNRLSMIM